MATITTAGEEMQEKPIITRYLFPKIRTLLLPKLFWLIIGLN